MKNIIPDIATLVQYIKLLSSHKNINQCSKCHNCGCYRLWKHGYYYRKSGRQKIPIQRLKCSKCGHTCSVLPECMPPRRWYLWEVQQATLLMALNGESYRSIAAKTQPVRSTIARWIKQLKERTRVYADCLKSSYPNLGRFSEFKTFWQECFGLLPLSKIMLKLNNSGVVMP